MQRAHTQVAAGIGVAPLLAWHSDSAGTGSVRSNRRTSPAPRASASVSVGGGRFSGARMRGGSFSHAAAVSPALRQARKVEEEAEMFAPSPPRWARRLSTGNRM
ncbi:hypothetical protein GCM10007937_33460 [Mesorhizobium albiziae]|nr:hypothetical protein GCM10007937_33460 [Mesorhizobium albiziae]